jgi:hypothetical protein
MMLPKIAYISKSTGKNHNPTSASSRNCGTKFFLKSEITKTTNILNILHWLPWLVCVCHNREINWYSLFVYFVAKHKRFALNLLAYSTKFLHNVVYFISWLPAFFFSLLNHGVYGGVKHVRRSER